MASPACFSALFEIFESCFDLGFHLVVYFAGKFSAGAVREFTASSATSRGLVAGARVAGLFSLVVR